MRKNIMIIITILVTVSFLSVNISAEKTTTKSDEEDNLDQYNEESNVIIIHRNQKHYSFAQSFTPTFNILTRVEVKRASGVSSGSPTHAILTIRSDINGNNIAKPIIMEPDDLFDYWLEFDIPDLKVIPGKTYYLVWNSIGGAWGYYGDDSNNPYPYGKFYSYKQYNFRDEWYEKPNADMCFRTYGRNGDDGNSPPQNPVLIESIVEGKVGVEYNFKFSSGDIDGDNVKYKIKSNEKSFSIGNSFLFESELFDPTELGDFKVIFDTPTVYFLEVFAVDELGSESPYSLDLDTIFISDYQNTAPMKPELTADDFTNYNTEYKCTAVTYDCDKDQIWYKFNWGEDIESEWLGPYDNGEECIASHIWRGGFASPPKEAIIKVKAKDNNGIESEWSEGQDILIMERSKTQSNQMFKDFILKLYERFPWLQYLLNL
jgi:hypothetical protein